MIHARVFAKHLQKYTSDIVVIRAMPGASGIVAANYLYNSAPKDGSEIGTIDTRVFLQGVTKPETAQYELANFTWLGAAVDNRKEPFLLLAKAGPEPLISGVESSFPINNIGLINTVLGWNIKQITGYPDSAQVKLAFDRGEINLISYSLTGLKTTAPDLLQSSSVMPLIQYGSGLKRHSDYPSVPTAMEFAKSKEEVDLISAFEGILALGRAFAGPPNLPFEKKNELHVLFKSVTDDLEYIEDAKKIGVNVSPVSWQETEETVKAIGQTSLGVVTKIKSF